MEYQVDFLLSTHLTPAGAQTVAVKAICLRCLQQAHMPHQLIHKLLWDIHYLDINLYIHFSKSSVLTMLTLK